MRRLLLLSAILAVILTASVLADRANKAVEPEAPNTTNVTASLNTPVLNARRIPEWLRRPRSNQEFSVALSRVLNKPSVPTNRCLKVHRDGIEIAAENSNSGLVPAELQRLVTVAAVASFPPDTVFVTKVVGNESSVINEGVLEGDIFLVGGADPVLSTSDYLSRFATERTATSFDQLAAELSAALRRRGITSINGAVVGDEFRFSPRETDYVGTVWSEADNANNEVGPLSGLLVNDGFIWDRQTESITRAEDPATNAVALLTELLVRRGININGDPRSGEQPPSADQVELAKIESPAIAEIAMRALLDATTAEMLFKEVGRTNGLSAASNDAFYGMLVALFQQGLPIEGNQPRDGSGLSDQNKVTCDLLMAIIERNATDGIARSALTPIAASVLAPCAPIGGTNMRILSADRGSVTALVGEMIASNGATITFTLIANADTELTAAEDFQPCNSIQTSLLETVAAYPENYGPPQESISPLAVVTAQQTS